MTRQSVCGCEVAKAMEGLRCPISAFLFPVFCFVIFFLFFPFTQQNHATHFFSPPFLPSTVKHLHNHSDIISPSPSSSPSPSPSPSSLYLLSNFTPANETNNSTTVLGSSSAKVRCLKLIA